MNDKGINAPSRKGIFIPDITVEMFRNASLEGVEELMTSGEMEDISLPSAQPEQRWIPCSERLPKIRQWVLCQCRAGIIDVLRLTDDGCWYRKSNEIYMSGFVLAWMPLPEPYRGGEK